MHFYSSMHTGGIELNLVNTLPLLNEGKFRTSLCLFRDEGSQKDMLTDAGVTVYHEPGKGRLNPIRILKLAHFLKNNDITVACAHLHQNYVPISIAARLAGTPVMIACLHNDRPIKKAFHRWQERLASHFITRYVAVSASVEKHHQNYNKNPSSSYEIIHNCIRLEDFQTSPESRAATRRQLGISPDQKVIVGVGRLTPGKNFEHLLHVTRELRDKYDLKPKVLIVGGEGRRQQGRMEILQSLCSELGLEDQVQLLGECTNIADILGASDIFCSSSTIEGFSIATLEAQAAGLPIIATNSAGIQENLGKLGEFGLVPIGNISAMAEKISVLLQDQNIYAAQKAIALENCKRFSMEKQVRRLENLYSELIEQQQSL